MSEEKESKRLLAVLGGAHSLNHSLFVIAPPLLLMIMADLGVTDYASMGVVATIASFIYGAGSLIGGPLGDKIGERKTITLFLILSGASTFLMLVSSNIAIYGLVLALVALWASLYHPTSNSLLSKTFREGTGEAMGLHGMGGTLGVMLTPTVAYFIGARTNWRFSFIFFGILCLILALFLIRKSRAPENKTTHVLRFREVLNIPQLGIILVFNITIGLFMKGVELFLPTYLTSAKGFDPFWASIAFTVLLASGVPAQWLGGRTSDSIGCKKVLILTSFGVILSLLLLQFLSTPIFSVALFVVIYGFSFYAHQPALNSLTGLLSPEWLRGTIYGIFFFTSFGIGSISQSIAGYFADIYGIESAFLVLTGFAIAALALSLAIPDIRKRNKTTRNN